MFRRNRNNNLPQPGANPNQTLQNAANQARGPHAQSRARTRTKLGATILGGTLFLTAGTAIGEFLGHSEDVNAGPNRTEQILQGQKDRHAGFYCDIATIALDQATDYSSGARVTLGITTGGADSVTYLGPLETQHGQVGPDMGIHMMGGGGGGQEYNVVGSIVPEAYNKRVAIYAVNAAGSVALCDHSVMFETVDPSTQKPMEPQAILYGIQDLPTSYDVHQ
jgi:hypothetical protein